jgi:hypothetical protein
MSKRLTPEQFDRAVGDLTIGRRGRAIARAVLVDGIPQATYVKKFKLTRGAISQVVSRVWQAHQDLLPPDYERVVAVLPRPQALIVRKWEAEAKKRIEARGKR